MFICIRDKNNRVRIIKENDTVNNKVERRDSIFRNRLRMSRVSRTPIFEVDIAVRVWVMYMAEEGEGWGKGGGRVSVHSLG